MIVLIGLLILVVMVFIFSTKSNFSCYRKMKGGHWELWYVDVVHAQVWYRTEVCSNITGHRPTGICRGTPKCEDH